MALVRSFDVLARSTYNYPSLRRLVPAVGSMALGRIPEWRLRFGIVGLLVLLATASGTKMNAQTICPNSGWSFDNPRCQESVATYSIGYCPSGHCRFGFTDPSSYTVLAATPSTRTYFIPQANGATTITWGTVFDSVLNCNASMDWTDRFNNFTFPTITGSIPPCPTVGQTYTYYTKRWQNGAPYGSETISWSITGGTIIGNTQQTVFPYTYDTVKVQWNANGPHRLISTRNGTNFGAYGPWACTNRDTIWDGAGQPPVIQGPSTLCGGTTTATYQAFPAMDAQFTYTWSCTNGTIVSGQGTGIVTVDWTGNGVLTLTRSAIPCGWTDVTTKGVLLSSSPNPIVNLGPNLNPCVGAQVILDAGPGQSYHWSNQMITRTLLPTSSGQFAVTVTDAQGCTGTGAVTVTFSGNLTTGLPYADTFCTGTTITPGVFTSYQWSNGATTPSIAPATTGLYTVTVSNGGCYDTDYCFVTIASTLQTSLPATANACQGSSVLLNPGNFSTYAWSTGATTQSISASTPGNYTVTVTDGMGCSATATCAVTVSPNPTPNLGPFQNVCTGTPVTLNPGAYPTYSWSNGATTPTISPTTSGSYSVTVTDAVGCTGTSSTMVTFTPLPGINLGADTSICADTSLTILGPPGMSSYSWSTGATSQNIVVTSGGNYTLTVTNSSGCSASDSKLVTGLTDCVFPGDANYDGVADNADVLTIGAYYGFAGAARPGASMQWHGQPLADWGSALPGIADPKHSDCDGNGIVAAVDTQAVTLNYGLTHNKGSGITGGPVILNVRALADSVYPGDPAWFVVEMGDAQNVADSAYGIALRMTPSGTALGAAGIFHVDYSNCWFAASPNRLDFTQPLGPAGPVDVAVVRNDQNEQSGFGEVFRFAVATDGGLVPVRDVLQVSLSNVAFVDANLTPAAFTVSNGTVVVSYLVTGMNPSPIPAAPTVFPNPTHDWIAISQPGYEILTLAVHDAMGRQVARAVGPQGRLICHLEGLSKGIYFLHIATSAGNYVQRIVFE